LTDPKRSKAYSGPVIVDAYGRKIPKHAHGTANIGRQTSSTKLITEAVMDLYDRIVNPSLLIRRLNISANHVVPEHSVKMSHK
jgi:DNA polymerase V